MSSYTKCRRGTIEIIMKEYENKKLKQRNGKLVKSRRMAVAIALSIAQKQCKLTQKSLKEIEDKVLKFLKNDTRKIADTRVPLTNVIETRLLIKNLLKEGKKRKANKFYKLLLKRIRKAQNKKIKITENIKKEITKIEKLLD